MSFSSELFKLYGTIDINGASAISDMTQAEAAGRRLSGVLGSVTKQAMGVAAGFGLFSVGSKALNFLRETFIGFNADMEGVQIGFTTMMGSAEAAASFTEELLNFAAKTPFEFPQLQQAAQRMQAFGFEAEKVIPMMTAIGDASAGLGRGQEGVQRLTLALGQMKAKGKIQAEEMLQLTEVGVNGWKYLADATGMTTMELQKMSQKGLLPANEAIGVIVAGMEKQFPGMMKNMEDTWEGVTSTIKDNARMLIAGLTQNTFAFMKDGLIQVRDYMANVMEIFKADGWQGLWDNLVPPDIQRTLGPILAMFASAYESIKQGAKDILPVFLDIARTGAVLLSPIVLGLGAAAKAAGEFASLIANNWGKLKPILTTTLALFMGYKAVVITMDLAKKAVFAFQVTTSLFSITAKAVQAGGRAFKAFQYVPKTLAEVRAAIILTKVVAVGELMLIATGVTAVIALATELVRNWSAAVPAMKSIAYAIGAVFKWVGSAATVMGHEIQYGIASALRATVGNVLSFARSVTGIFAPLAEALPDQFKSLYDGLNGGLASAVQGMDDFKMGAGAALDAAKGDLAAAGAAISANVDTMKGNWSTLKTAVLTDLSGVFGRAKATVANSFAGMTAASDDATAAMLDWDTAAKKMQDAMDETVGAAEKGKGAAKGASAASKEAKEELDKYMSTLDPLKAKLDTIDAAMEANVVRLEETGDEAGAAQTKIDGLTQKLAVQREMIASLQAKHQEYVATKGADAEATIEVQNALSDAIKQEAQFRGQITAAQKDIAEYNKKLIEHQKELQQTGQDVADLADKYRTDLAQAAEDYYQKVAEAEAQLAADTASAWDSYDKSVEDRAKSLRDFAGLFGEVTRESVSGDSLLANMRGQVDAMNEWQEAMAALQARGIGGSLYKALQDLGPSSVDQIIAMANMTDDELTQYVALWEEKEQDAKNAAVQQLEDLKSETEAKVSELQAQTAAQLEEYRLEWEQAQTEIKNQTIQSLTELVKAAGEKGAEFTQTLINAVKKNMPEFSSLLDQLVPEGDQPGPAGSPERLGGPEAATGADRMMADSSGETAAAIQQNNQETTELVKTTWEEASANLDLTHQTIKDNMFIKWTEITAQVKDFCTQIIGHYKQLTKDAQAEFNTIDKTIRDVMNGLVAAAPKWGENFVKEYVRGIYENMDYLREALSEMAEMVENYVGFSSPTKLGPGAKADEWAPNLVSMFSQGLMDTLPMMQVSLNDMFNTGSMMLAVAGGGSGNVANITVYVDSGQDAVGEITRELRLRGWRGI